MMVQVADPWTQLQHKHMYTQVQRQHSFYTSHETLRLLVGSVTRSFLVNCVIER